MTKANQIMEKIALSNLKTEQAIVAAGADIVKAVKQHNPALALRRNRQRAAFIEMLKKRNPRPGQHSKKLYHYGTR